MNQQSPETEHHFNLPEPHNEISGASESEPVFLPAGEKETTQALEQSIGKPFDDAAASFSASPANTPASMANSVPMSTGIMPLIADDADLIEKEWVEKAKQIVDSTKHDPYRQNKELTRVKADYLKKRYNKDIKLNEE